ncbi:MAG: hypothetical protein DRJ47_03600 [Thermoprotei archaeon]|nr:MAG: hypothetical protein DRJ47_03600 [Thermoprotei archaeon]
MYDSEEVLRFLRELGLTGLEAKAYVTLLINGEMSATELAKAMNMHFPQLYNIMSSLEVKGFIEVQEGRPKRYKAVDIGYVTSRRIAEIKSKAKKVKKILKEARQSPAYSRPSIWITLGMQNILRNLIELINDSKYDVLIVIHRDYVGSIRKPLVSARKRGVQTYLVIYPGDEAKELTTKFKAVKRVSVFETYPFAILGVADSSRAVLSHGFPKRLPPEKLYGIVFDEPIMPLFLTEDFYQIWIKAIPLVESDLSLPATFTSQRLALIELKKIIKKHGKATIKVKGIYVKNGKPFEGIGTVKEIIENEYQKCIVMVMADGTMVSIGGPYASLEDVEAQLITILSVER